MSVITNPVTLHFPLDFLDQLKAMQIELQQHIRLQHGTDFYFCHAMARISDRDESASILLSCGLSWSNISTAGTFNVDSYALSEGMKYLKLRRRLSNVQRFYWLKDVIEKKEINPDFYMRWSSINWPLQYAAILDIVSYMESRICEYQLSVGGQKQEGV